MTFSKQVETSTGWLIKPSLDLGAILATGDIKARGKTRFPGTKSKAELNTNTIDYMSSTRGLDPDVAKDNLNVGMNYNMQGSEHCTSHGVFCIMPYEF